MPRWLEIKVMGCLRLAFLSTYFTIPLVISAQTLPPIPIKVAQTYFAEAQSLCQADHGQLWGVSLCGPIMFVDPGSRQVVANIGDANSLLKPQAGVFVGSLPADQNIANTAVEWSGVHWTQMLWPLPDQQMQRQTLMAHELFHRIQDQLGLPKIPGGDNADLDTLDGRYTLQLEWRALARALKAGSDGDRRTAVRDAILFRAERYRLFPDAAAQERALELNEGLAEYTGVRVGNKAPEQQIDAALRDLSVHQDDNTFVRSFAYATGPAYGLLLDRYDPGWHRQLEAVTGLGTLLQNAVHVVLPANLHLAADRQATRYDGVALHASEVIREDQRQRVAAQYRARFIDGPVLTLRFRHMHVQFDPRNLHPLDKAGTVYPTMRISDDWGILDAKNGALMKSDWSAVVIVAPTTNAPGALKGDGWTLDLLPGWKIAPGHRKGDFILESGS